MFALPLSHLYTYITIIPDKSELIGLPRKLLCLFKLGYSLYKLLPNQKLEDGFE